ncbi:hypothetical protein OHS70_37750 [Streptomyces sp. NBC_00390]|uniref:hypothetical protein n=1 Tax=Streptomyces sp. NBC_00390 TaxID=2975736 RepID=UPI002E23702B
MGRMKPGRILTTVVALGGGMFLLGGSLLRLETQLTGTPGHFRAEHCEIYDTDGDDDGLTCSGPFEAEDGSFRIAEVEVDTTFDEKPTEPVAVTVDGPSAAGAVKNENGVWLIPGATGLVCLLVGAWNVRQAVRSRGAGPSGTNGATSDAGTADRPAPSPS